MAKKSFPLSKVYGLLEPGPVVMVTTAREGKAHIMTMSWHTMMEFEPPTVGCVISIPTVELAAKAVACGNTSGRHVDKFRTFGLTPVPASRVAAPLIGECYANLECRVMDARMVAKYNFFILEVLKAWIDPSRKVPRTIHHLGKGAFMVAGRTIKLPSKMK
jgi:flavin reductase (DIM6/NTAB) family NADH-FMN oxidoreductase RutF